MYEATFFQWRREAASAFDVDLVIFTTKKVKGNIDVKRMEEDPSKAIAPYLFIQKKGNEDIIKSPRLKNTTPNAQRPNDKTRKINTEKIFIYLIQVMLYQIFFLLLRI